MAPPAKTISRPLSDWLSTQGASNVFGDFVWGNYAGWTDPRSGQMYVIDYAGLANHWLTTQSGGAINFGTTITGSVLEHPQADGSSLVEVSVRVHNAVTFVVGFDPNNGADFTDERFGHLPTESLTGADTALGDCTMQVRFTIPHTGGPLPDLEDTFASGDVTYIHVTSSATGTLPTNSGFPDGTSGSASTIQQTAFTPGQGRVLDGFPSERVVVRAGP
jgi:hypothetical protein